MDRIRNYEPNIPVSTHVHVCVHTLTHRKTTIGLFGASAMSAVLAFPYAYASLPISD